MTGSAQIVLTRTTEDCASWAANLRERGLDCVSLPCIETERFTSMSLQTAVENAVADADWLVLTSQRGVSSVAALLGGSLPSGVRIAVVGASTAHSAQSLLGHADFVAGESTAAGLARELSHRLQGSEMRIILALAQNAGDVLSETLKQAGHKVRRFDVYRTIPATAGDKRLTLTDIGSDLIFLASPSAVLGLVNQVALDGAARLISIGPTTTAAIERAGLKVYAEAATPNLAGMLAAIKD